MKPTQALQRTPFRKLRLTTKDVNKGYYKGTGSGSMGTHTKYGGFVLDFSKIRTFVVPKGMSTFKLTPFVTENVKPAYGGGGYAKDAGPGSAKLYLERWKADNGLD